MTDSDNDRSNGPGHASDDAPNDDAPNDDAPNDDAPNAAAPGSGTGIRITSTPDETSVDAPTSSDAPVEAVEMPFRVLFVDDLTPRDAPEDGAAPSRVWRVDAHTFADRLAEAAPVLDVEVPNHVGDAPETLTLHTSVTALSDFDPAGLADAVPPLRRLMQVRALVAQVRDRTITLDAFRDALQERGVDPDWTRDLYARLVRDANAGGDAAGGSDAGGAGASTSGSASGTAIPDGLDDDGSLDRLLSMVDTDDAGDASSDPASDATSDAVSDPAPDPAAASLLDRLVDAATGLLPKGSPAVEPSAAEALVAELDRIAAAQLAAIYEHPEVRALERAWRGLKMLVDRFDFRSGVELEVLPARAADLEEAMYEQVLMPEHERTEGDPLSLVVMGHTFGREAVDLKRLRDLAETGLSLQTPVLASVDHRFFGLDALGDLADLPIVWQHLDDAAYAGWNALRDEDAAGFLSVTLPPIALRGAVDAGDGPTVDVPLWGAGALGLAAAIADSYARTGWPTHLQDPASEPVGNVPVVRAGNTASPLAALIPSRKQSELSDAGFVVLDARPNTDAVYVSRAPSVQAPRSYHSADANAEARAHVSLVCRLFLSRAAHFLLRLQRGVPDGLAAEDAPAWLDRRLRAFYRQGDVTDVPDDAVSVEPVEEADLPNATLLAVRLRPPSSIAALEYDVSLVMGFQAPA